MALIAEAFARWPSPAEEAEVRARLHELCDGLRASRPTTELVAALPEAARPAASEALDALARLSAKVGRRLVLTVDTLGLRQQGTLVQHVGLGVGDGCIMRLDDLGATRQDAEALAAALQGLLAAFSPEFAGTLLLD